MTKIFGFLMAVAMSAGFANAALLATWNFESNANGVVPSGINGTAGAFQNFGSADATAGNNGARDNATKTWLTSSVFKDASTTLPDITKGNVFSFKNTSSSPPTLMNLQSLSFNASTLAVPNTIFNVNSANVNVYGRLVGGSFSLLGTALVGPSTTSVQTINFSQSLSANQEYEFLFSYTGLALTAGFIPAPVQVRLDNITLEGSDNVVPEPASIACFAGLMTVGALRRLRKKQ